LNGAILGMKRTEILKKFDEIVAFAEVERFIDTAVKHYSSGMYLRLAFAVAAHLEPEILLVDEVLAVGDAVFQKRCLGKMGDVTKQGRTVVFVSHNIEAIQRLCSHAVLLEKGQVGASGDTASVVAKYIARDYQRPAPGTRIDLSECGRFGTGVARFVSVTYTNGSTVADGRPYPDGPLEFLLEIESDAPRPVGSLAVSLSETYGARVINADTMLIDRPVQLERGRNFVQLSIRALHLVPGFYRVGLWLADPIQSQEEGGEYDSIQPAFEIEVVNEDHAVSYLAWGETSLVTCDFAVEEIR
jgi:lipopolysaccharide transport system ATP-binding protein